MDGGRHAAPLVTAIAAAAAGATYGALWLAVTCWIIGFLAYALAAESSESMEGATTAGSKVTTTVEASDSNATTTMPVAAKADAAPPASADLPTASSTAELAAYDVERPLAGHISCEAVLCELAAAALDIFRASCEPAALEKAWGECPVAKSGRGVVVRSRPQADSPYHLFRIDCTLIGVRARQVEASFGFPERPRWDRTVEHGTCIVGPTPIGGSARRVRHATEPPSAKGTTTTEVDVSSTCTRPNGPGNIVKGRSFVDLRAVSVSVDEQLLETHHSTSQALPPQLIEATPAAKLWLEIADAEKRTLARNLVGGGSRLVESWLPDGRRAVQITQIVASEFGGGLPVWLVNNETPKAVHDMMLKLQRHLGAEFVV
jgi:hypothetical protein